MKMIFEKAANCLDFSHWPAAFLPHQMKVGRARGFSFGVWLRWLGTKSSEGREEDLGIVVFALWWI